MRMAAAARATLPVAARSPRTAERILKPVILRLVPAPVKKAAGTSAKALAPAHARASVPPQVKAPSLQRAMSSLARATPHLDALAKKPGIAASIWHGVQAARELRGLTRELSRMQAHGAALDNQASKSGAVPHQESKRGPAPVFAVGAVRHAGGQSGWGPAQGTGPEAGAGSMPGFRVHISRAHGPSLQGPIALRFGGRSVKIDGFGAIRRTRARAFALDGPGIAMELRATGSTRRTAAAAVPAKGARNW
jgi:hypothetical protein